MVTQTHHATHPAEALSPDLHLPPIGRRASAPPGFHVVQACPVCRSADLETLLQKNRFPIRQCRSCALVFTGLMPDRDMIENIYSEKYFTQGGDGYTQYIDDETAHRRQARYYLRRMANFGIRPPGRLLDVGCAAGFFLDEARTAGWEIQGLDVSRYALTHAIDRLTIPAVHADLLEADLPPVSFDAITMFNVFEHLPDPIGAVERLGTLLKPGGHLLIETWDRRSLAARAFGSHWHQYSPPSVLYFYDRRTFLNLFSKPAWRVIGYGKSLKWISLNHGLSLIEYMLGERWLAVRLNRFIQARLSNLLVPYRLGDLVLAVLRRS